MPYVLQFFASVTIFKYSVRIEACLDCLLATEAKNESETNAKNDSMNQSLDFPAALEEITSEPQRHYVWRRVG